MDDAGDAKLRAQEQWNRTPCGTGEHVEDVEYGSLEFFEAIRRSRYEDTDRWMLRTLPFSMGQGKSVLEIGHGIGSDLVTWAEAGARVSGIDITREHHELCTRNFRLRGIDADLRLCDAAALSFADGSFDIVYSNGVLHHTPDTVRCVGEAYRVLKPGGTLVLTMYHSWSAVLGWLLLRRGILGGGLWSKGYRGVLATIESGADGVAIKPLVKTYSRSNMKAILGDFEDVRIRLAHVGLHRLRWADRWLGPLVGWYVVAIARKPGGASQGAAAAPRA